MGQIRAIERRKVSDEVFSQMKEMIANGDWKPGDKIPSENELKELFQVSRVTIREAIKKLASYNIIETRQGSGSYIREVESIPLFRNEMLSVYFSTMDDCTIRDMMEFRSIIEVESVYLATKRGTEQDLAYLEDDYQKMLAARGDIRQFSYYDLEFHKYIAEMTKNVVLIKCYSVVWDFVKEYFDKVVEKIGVEKGSFYHGEILKAMRARDAKAAKRVMREHLSVTAEGFFDSGL